METKVINPLAYNEKRTRVVQKHPRSILHKERFYLAVQRNARLLVERTRRSIEQGIDNGVGVVGVIVDANLPRVEQDFQKITRVGEVCFPTKEKQIDTRVVPHCI